MSSSKIQNLDWQEAARLLVLTKSQILRDWELRCREKIPAAKSKNRLVLLNSLPHFLDQLVVTLRSPHPQEVVEENAAIASEHGTQRAELENYNLEQVIFEYHLFRGVLVKTLEAERPLDSNTRECLDDFIDRAIRKAASRYAEIASAQQAEFQAETEAARKVLLKSKDFLWEALDNSQMNTWEINLKTGKCVIASRLAALFGANVEAEDPSEVIRKYVHPEDASRVSRVVNESIQNRTPYQDQYRIIKPDGTVLWIMSRGDLKFDSNGEPISMSGLITNITKQKLAELEVERSQRELHDFFMQAPFPMVILEGPDHRYTLANPQYEKFIGKKALGKKVSEIFSQEEAPGEAEKFIHLLDNVYQTGIPFIGREIPLNIPHESGVTQNLWVDFSYHPFRDAQGGIKGISAIIQDVTEKVLARKVIEESETRYRKANEQLDLVLENAQMATWQIDLKAGSKTVLSGVIALIGEGVESGNVHEGIRQRLYPEDAAEATLIVNNAIQNHTSYSHEYRIIRKDQSVRWVLSKGTPRYSKEGVPVFISGVIMDITERKQRDDQLRAITELVPQFIWMSDEKGAITYSNPQLLDYLGVDQAQTAGARWIELLHPDDREQVIHEWQKAIETGKSYEMEVRIRSKAGTYGWFLNRATPIREKKSAIVNRWLGIAVDISDRKAAENELKRTISVLNSIMATTSDSIYVKDRDSRMIYCNPITLSRIGVDASELYGKNDLEFLGPSHGGEEILRNDQRIMSFGVGETAEEWVTWHDGTKRLYMSQKEPQRNSNGEVIGLIGISRDITELKHTQTELEKSVRARDEFLSIASHELKTPLTSLTLLNQIRKRQLLKGQTSAFTLENLGNIFHSDLQYLTKLNHLIEDMLDITRIRTGKLELQKKSIDLSSLVREVVERLRPQLIEAQIDVEIETCQTAFIYADSFRFEQVITNLLLNSIKYGQGKPIQIQVNQKRGRMVSLRVIDQGIGIGKEDQKRVFLPFERAVSANEVSGLGLGLAIVQSLIKAHDGRISLESELGKGSTFTIELPLIEEGPNP